MSAFLDPRGDGGDGLDSSPVEPAPLDLPPLTEQTRLRGAGDHRPLPGRALGAAADAAPGAELPGLRLARGRRALRRGARPDQGRGRRGRDVLHDVQAPPDRPAPGQRLHQHAVRRPRWPEDHGRAVGRPRRAPRRDGGRRLDHLEHAECLAACDYAPVVTVDYEFYDQQDVESARELVSALRRGEKPLPTRGAPLTDFKGISRQLAGFDQHGSTAGARAAVDNPGEYGPTLIGLRLAEHRGESAPEMPKSSPSSTDSSAAEAAGVESAQRGEPEPARRDTGNGRTGTDTPAGSEPGTSGQAAREGLTPCLSLPSSPPAGAPTSPGGWRPTSGSRATAPCARPWAWRPTSSSAWSRTPACAAAAALASRPA